MTEQTVQPGSVASPAGPLRPSQAAPRDDRPAVVVVTSNPTPYRHALHARIDREIPGIRLLTVYTHAVPDQPWALREPNPDRVASFGVGDALADAADLTALPREWRKGGRMVRWLEQQNPRAVLLCGYNDPGRMRIFHWCRRRRVPVFLFADSNVHSDHASGLKTVLKRLVVGAVARRCDVILPCGRFGVEYFKRYGAAEDRMILMPYEPDYDMITSLGPDRIRQTVERLELERAGSGRRRIVYCARLVDIKRPDLAIAAFDAVADQRPDFDLVMIGDGPMRADLQARIPERLQSRIIFTGFLGDQADISAIYRASDVLIHPSVLEPWGVVINEAVAAGMAIVVTSTVGAAAELVADGVNGRKVPPDDLPALTAALLEVTDAANLASLRGGSAGLLAEWRSRADPVDGLRRALRRVGVLAD